MLRWVCSTFDLQWFPRCFMDSHYVCLVCFLMSWLLPGLVPLPPNPCQALKKLAFNASMQREDSKPHKTGSRLGVLLWRIMSQAQERCLVLGTSRDDWYLFYLVLWRYRCRRKVIFCASCFSGRAEFSNSVGIGFVPAHWSFNCSALVVCRFLLPPQVFQCMKLPCPSCHYLPYHRFNIRQLSFVAGEKKRVWLPSGVAHLVINAWARAGFKAPNTWCFRVIHCIEQPTFALLSHWALHVWFGLNAISTGSFTSCHAYAGLHLVLSAVSCAAVDLGRNQCWWRDLGPLLTNAAVFTR